MMRPRDRRAFLHLATFGAAATATAAGCTSASGPAQSLAKPAAPQATIAPAVSPVAAAAEPTPARGWEDLIAAAQAEGRLALLTLVGGGYGTVIDRFQQAFPDITVHRLAESSAGVWLRQVQDDRRVGRLAFDLAFVQPNRALTEGRSADLWAPLRPLLVRPDVLADQLWRDGLDARFMDTSGSLCLAWEYQVIHAYAINTDMVPVGAITSVKDLLDPRWKGRILSLDPSGLGTAALSAAAVAQHWGTDVVKQLLIDQQPTFRSWGPADVTAAIVDGQVPIALGVRPKALNPLRAQGRGHHIQYLDLPDADFVGATGMLYFDQAPHPAAARLFANWVLTHEVQTILASSLLTNSARTDVPSFEPDGIGPVGTPYYEPEREATYAHTAATQQFIAGLRWTRN
jgi:iron(III) transport system substrate-binding protein